MSGALNHPIGQGLIVLLVVVVHALAFLEFTPEPPGPLRIARPLDVALIQAPRPAIPPNPAPPPEPPPPLEATTAPTPKTPPQPAPPRPVPPQRAGHAPHAPVPAPAPVPVAKPKPAPTPQPKPVPKPEPKPTPAQPKAPKPTVEAHHEPAPLQAPPKRLDLGSLSQQITEVSTDLNHKRTAQADGLRFLHINATNAAQHKAADYLYGWERKLRDIGRLGPGSAKTGGGDGSGSVHLRIALRADGSLYKMEKIHSSGDRDLDAAAEGIVQRAVPLPPFPKGLREECDVLVNDRVFQFENGNLLEQDR
ncbi:energy transducer TonB [Methylomagnum ishizawai]|uniref:energy transducer TonB n=1 Tax=Methylomagnum ishizawai TaxID=1760988 RepID=UPI001C331035|nr:energy transducer TonB [Methylomagnum ishizawai]BBL73486.1 hypothetical protein MishRS11D_05840 [Methylomagnum ishizawai]